MTWGTAEAIYRTLSQGVPCHPLKNFCISVSILERQYTETETAEQYVRKILGIPENLKVASIISIGYPDEVKTPHTEDDLGFDKVHLNKFLIEL